MSPELPLLIGQDARTADPALPTLLAQPKELYAGNLPSPLNAPKGSLSQTPSAGRIAFPSTDRTYCQEREDVTKATAGPSPSFFPFFFLIIKREKTEPTSTPVAPALLENRSRSPASMQFPSSGASRLEPVCSDAPTFRWLLHHCLPQTPRIATQALRWPAARANKEPPALAGWNKPVPEKAPLAGKPQPGKTTCLLPPPFASSPSPPLPPNQTCQLRICTEQQQRRGWR